MSVNQKTPSAAPQKSDLEKEAVSAPEAAWFGAWFKSAAVYLAAITVYLGVATALVAAWKKLRAGTGEQPDLTIYILAGTLALPLLFSLLFNLLPALRRRRELSLRPAGAGDTGYFTTAPREDDPHSLFATGYDHFIEWTARPASPLLHLSGLSGSGKSSLLAACLRPRLAAGVNGEITTLLILRSYTDPLATLKEALLPLWKKRPDDYDAVSPLDALRRAAKQLGKKERLMVAFDQFEEFFLLRAMVPTSGPTLRRDAAASSPLVALKDSLLSLWKTPSSPAAQFGIGDRLVKTFDHLKEFFFRNATVPPNQPFSEGDAPTSAPLIEEAGIAPVREFLHGFLADPPDGVTLLLSYRWDHQGLLIPLRLPARTDGINHRSVEPLDFATAAGFIRRCPGLMVPETRMNRVLREAARQEGGRVVMRPIVANLLGLILQKMAGHPTLWRRTGDLLRGYVADAISGELIEDRARILRALLTDFHTVRPRAIVSLALETRLDPIILAGQVESLGRTGLLRCVNAAENDPARRVWQITHDFLATLIERVLDGVHRTFWRAIRPWLAPAAAVAALGAGLVWPSMEKRWAVQGVENAGFHWNEELSLLEPINARGYRVISLVPVNSHLRRLQPREIDLKDCTFLKEVDGLKGLTALQELNLNRCTNLRNLDGLKGLPSLRRLFFRELISLENVDGLKGLTSVEELYLNGCNRLKNVDALSGLTGLRNLGLRDCANLENVNGLKGLNALEEVLLSDCVSLKNLDGLKALTGPLEVDLSDSDLSESALQELRSAMPNAHFGSF